MTERDPEINMSSIPVAGLGGLGLVIMVAVVAYAMPVVRDFTLLSIAGGVVGGSVLAAYRWWRPDPGSAAKGPTLITHQASGIRHQASGIRHQAKECAANLTFARGRRWKDALDLGQRHATLRKVRCTTPRSMPSEVTPTA